MDRALQVTDYLIARSAQEHARAADVRHLQESPRQRAFCCSCAGYNAQQDSCLYEILPHVPLSPVARPACCAGRLLAARRKGRPQQAHEHRGGRPALRRPEADQRLHRQGGGDQGHHRDPRRRASTCGRTRRATSTAWSRPSRASWPSTGRSARAWTSSSRARREVIEYDGRADRVKFIKPRRDAALSRRHAERRDRRQPDHLRQQHRRVHRGRRRPPARRGRRGRVRAVLAPRARRIGPGRRRRRPRRRRSCAPSTTLGGENASDRS